LLGVYSAGAGIVSSSITTRGWGDADGLITLTPSSVLEIKRIGDQNQYGETIIFETDVIDGTFGRLKSYSLNPKETFEFYWRYARDERGIPYYQGILSSFERANFMDDIAQSHNQKEAAEVVWENVSLSDRELLDQVENLYAKKGIGAVRNALDSLSGEFLARSVAMSAEDTVSNVIFRKLDAPLEGEYVNQAWADLSINGAQDLKGNSLGFYDQRGQQALMGLNLTVRDEVITGAFLKAGASHMSLDSNTSDRTDIEAGLYGSYIAANFRLKMNFGLGRHIFNNSRKFKLYDLTYKPTSEFSAYSIKANFEAIADAPLASPYLSLKSAFVLNDEVEESGGGKASLIMENNTYLKFAAGAGLETRGTVKKNIRWKVRGGLEYVFVGREESSQYNMRFAASNDNVMQIRAFDVKNELPSIVGAAGADMDISKQVSLSLAFDINAGTEMTAYGAGLGINYSFGKSSSGMKKSRLAKQTGEEEQVEEPSTDTDEGLEISEPQEMSSIIDDRLVLNLLVEVNGKQQWITPLIINSTMYKEGSAQLQPDSEQFVIGKMKELAKYRNNVKRIRVERHVPSGKTPDNADMRLSAQRAVSLYRILVRQAQIKTPAKNTVNMRVRTPAASATTAKDAAQSSAQTAAQQGAAKTQAQ
jgi:flagellar motor protein MotB